MVAPNNHWFPTKKDHFGVFFGYHYFRKHPYRTTLHHDITSRCIMLLSHVRLIHKYSKYKHFHMAYVIIIVCIQTAKRKHIFSIWCFFSIAIRYCQLDFPDPITVKLQCWWKVLHFQDCPSTCQSPKELWRRQDVRMTISTHSIHGTGIFTYIYHEKINQFTKCRYIQVHW